MGLTSLQHMLTAPKHILPIHFASWLQVTGADIGIITPYKAMAHMVQRQLAILANCQDIKVNTVDAFQGQEKKASSLFQHACLAWQIWHLLGSLTCCCSSSS